MIEVVVRLTPLAVGVALSPLIIIAVLVILLSKRAFPGSITLLVAWLAGILAAISVAIAFAETIEPPRFGTDLPSEGLFTLLLGVGLVTVSVISRRGRKLSPHGAEPPAWVSSVDRLSPTGAALLGFTHATTSPKNLALAISAGRIIVDARLSTAQSSGLVTYYTLIAGLTVIVPVVLYLLGGQRAVLILERWRERITANAAVSMEIILLLVGLAMSAKGIYNLLS